MKKDYSVQGRLLAAFLVILVLTSVWLFAQRRWWLPEANSVHGAGIDSAFLVTLVITGVLFVLLQLMLAYVSWRYRDKIGARADYWIRPRLEKRFAIVAGVIIFGVDIGIFTIGESQWFKAWGAPPPDTMLVEATGEQFMWTFRYPGEDGAFGNIEPELISATNTLGLDPRDPAGKDDIISVNQLHLPEGRPVRIRLRARDVIHSLFLPHFRIKQDAVPGMAIEIWFQPMKPGSYEIACAQLCGLAHYRMRAFLTVESDEAFNNWKMEMAGGGN